MKRQVILLYFTPRQLRGGFGGSAVLSGLRCCQQDWEDVETPSGDSQKYRTWCRWVVGVVTQASGSKTSDICVGVNEMASDSKSLTN